VLLAIFLDARVFTNEMEASLWLRYAERSPFL